MDAYPETIRKLKRYTFRKIFFRFEVKKELEFSGNFYTDL